MARGCRLSIERLEDRLAPAVSYGVAWPDPGHLTLSFAPDNTAAVGQPGVSQLFSTLRAQSADAAWQAALLRAFQTWAVNANINIGLVGDSGLPLGTNGAPQTDPRFGDIRIGTYPLSNNAVAEAMPFNVMAGTWGGDVKLNPAYFGPAGQYDLYSVMLHEAGHVFGVGDNADPTSAMYDVYAGVRTGLSSADVAQLQALYGTRQPDAHEGTAGNDTFATAAHLLAGKPINADVTTLSDVDVYQFQATGDGAPAALTLQTSGLSLLVGQMQVYDGAGNLVASAASAGPLGGDVTITLPSTVPGGTYYVKVQSATGDVFGVGGYRLTLQTGSAAATPPPSVSSALYPTVKASTATAPTTVTNLQAQTYRSSGLFNYTARSSLDGTATAQTFKFKTPNLGAAGAVITAMAWSSQAGGFTPSLTVYDRFGVPVAAKVLVNDAGAFSLQIPKALSNSFYTVTVSGPAGAGGYFLAVDFDIPVQAATTLLNSVALTAAQPNQYGVLAVTQSQLLHFTVSAGGPASAALQWTVYDLQGNVVLSTTVRGGTTATRNLYLGPGIYFFKFTQLGTTPLTVSLTAVSLSDPVGPSGTDVTLDSSSSSDYATVFWLSWNYGYLSYMFF